MATEVAPPTRWLADQWENGCGYGSAVLSGIVPDQSHLDDGGYHVSIEDLVRFGNAGDYSNRRTLDKAPPVTTAGRRYAAAVDMSMSRADMAKLYGRAKRVYDDRSDPRRRYLNAINVWDGVDGHSPRRLDFQANTNSTASADHTWHSHEDQPRAYVDVNLDEAEAWTAAKAFVSMAKGETVEQWLKSIGQGEEDMGTVETFTPAALKQVVDALVWARFHNYEQYVDGKPTGEPGSLLNSFMQTHAAARGADRNTVALGAQVAKLTSAVAALAAAGADDATVAQLQAVAQRMEQLAVEDRARDDAAADRIVESVVAKLPAELDGATHDQMVSAVSEGVRDAFAGGLAPAPTA